MIGYTVINTVVAFSYSVCLMFFHWRRRQGFSVTYALSHNLPSCYEVESSFNCNAADARVRGSNRRVQYRRLRVTACLGLLEGQRPAMPQLFQPGKPGPSPPDVPTYDRTLESMQSWACRTKERTV